MIIKLFSLTVFSIFIAFAFRVFLGFLSAELTSLLVVILSIIGLVYLFKKYGPEKWNNWVKIDFNDKHVTITNWKQIGKDNQLIDNIGRTIRFENINDIVIQEFNTALVDSYYQISLNYSNELLPMLALKDTQDVEIILKIFKRKGQNTK